MKQTQTIKLTGLSLLSALLLFLAWPPQNVPFLICIALSPLLYIEYLLSREQKKYAWKFLGLSYMAFIIWNASVWGSIFGFLGKTGGQFSGMRPYPVFGLIMFIVFAHMIIEAISYFLAAISGSIISKDVLLEEFASDRFMEVFSFNL